MSRRSLIKRGKILRNRSLREKTAVRAANLGLATLHNDPYFYDPTDIIRITTPDGVNSFDKLYTTMRMPACASDRRQSLHEELSREFVWWETIPATAKTRYCSAGVTVEKRVNDGVSGGPNNPCMRYTFCMKFWDGAVSVFTGYRSIYATPNIDRDIEQIRELLRAELREYTHYRQGYTSEDVWPLSRACYASEERRIIRGLITCIKNLARRDAIVKRALQYFYTNARIPHTGHIDPQQQYRYLHTTTRADILWECLNKPSC